MPKTMKGCRPLTVDEKKEIENSFYGRHAARNRTLFLLGVHTGFRISELLSVKVKDVWTGSGVRDWIKVRRSNMKAKKNGREVPLNPEIKQVLADYMAQHNPSPDQPLFASQKNPYEPINRFRAHRILKDVFDECGFSGSVATHSMRKTYAWGMYRVSGGDIHKVQKMMGHSSVATTVNYLGFSNEEASDLSNKYAELFK